MLHRLSRLRVLLLTALTIGLASGGIVALWACGLLELKPGLGARNRPAVIDETFAHVVFRHGLPEGIGPVVIDDLSHRSLTYRLTQRDGRIEARPGLRVEKNSNA
jgi:hypothetical protein